MPKISRVVTGSAKSRPISSMQIRYDAIVIGSGYGAGVAAARLAQAGKSVAVLERGREIPVGEFPSTLSEGARDFQADTPLGQIGAPDALFDMRAQADISVMVGCGLGGTSLINGNVMLEPESRVFSDSSWPEAIRKGRDNGLAKAYDTARDMLGSIPYPGAPKLAKFAALAQSAEALDGKATYPPISVTFEEQAGTNAAGIDQPACTLCGDCAPCVAIAARAATSALKTPLL